MDFYERVVIDYLRADRAIFLNTECCIQLNSGENPDTSGPHWYCDAVATDFREQCIFLCEISYSAQLTDLIKRLKGWHENWSRIHNALNRDSFLPKEWPVRPWLFVQESLLPLLLKRLAQFGSLQQPGSVDRLLEFSPRVTTLEMVQPWRYRSWNRVGEAIKPSILPEAMQK